MGFRYQKRIKLGGGIGLNVSRSGVSPSYRSKYGSVGPKGFSFRTGIPGLSYRGGKSGEAAIIFLAIIAIFGVFILAWNLLRFVIWLIAAFFSWLQSKQSASPTATLISSTGRGTQIGSPGSSLKNSSTWIFMRNLTFLAAAIFVAVLLLIPPEQKGVSTQFARAPSMTRSTVENIPLGATQHAETVKQQITLAEQIHIDPESSAPKSNIKRSFPASKNVGMDAGIEPTPLPNSNLTKASDEVAADVANEVAQTNSKPIPLVLAAQSYVAKTDATFPVYQNTSPSENSNAAASADVTSPVTSSAINSDAANTVSITDAMPSSLIDVVPPYLWETVRGVLIEGFSLGNSKQYIPWGAGSAIHGTIYQSGDGTDPEGCRQFRVSKLEPSPFAFAYADVCPGQRIK